MRAMIPNSTQIPDVILDHWMAELSGAEFKVLMYIARRTYGFGKDDDCISLKQIVGGIVRKNGLRLDQGTGLNKDTVCKALASLESRGIVRREQRSDETYGDLANSYSLNLDLPDPESEKDGSDPVSEKTTRGGAKSTPPPVGKSDTGSEPKNPTRGESENPTGGGRKSRQARVVKPDTQETDLQETEQQETATAGPQRTGQQDLFVAAADLSPSASPDPDRTESLALLVGAGFSERDAAALALAHPTDAIREQIGWMARRTVKKNRLGMLRRAIEERWPRPEADTEVQNQVQAQVQETRQGVEEARRHEIVVGLRSMYVRLESEAPEAFSAFLEHIEERKAKEATRPLISQSPKRLEAMLAAYDQEDRRLALMVEFFREKRAPLPEFEPLLAKLKGPGGRPLESFLHALH